MKVCGVTNLGDAQLAADLGAAYLGLNFFPKSPRFLSVERALEIADGIDRRLPLVGVFVDAPSDEVAEIAELVGLDLLQFHGDESPEAIAPFSNRAIKAFRGVPRAELEGFPNVAGFLFDAPAVPSDSVPGGTGRAWDYSALKPFASRLAPRPVFLAGGLGPENVRHAIETSGATHLDVCSGIESAPGIKDPDRLRRLFERIASFEELHVS